MTRSFPTPTDDASFLFFSFGSYSFSTLVFGRFRCSLFAHPITPPSLRKARREESSSCEISLDQSRSLSLPLSRSPQSNSQSPELSTRWSPSCSFPPNHPRLAKMSAFRTSLLRSARTPVRSPIQASLRTRPSAFSKRTFATDPPVVPPASPSGSVASTQPSVPLS